MNYKNFVKSAKHVGRQARRFLHKHGPKIATVASSVATIGGTVWACKKTIEVQPVVKAYAQEREMVAGDKAAMRKSYLSEAGYLAKEYAGPAASLVLGEALKIGAVVSLEHTVGELTLGIAALQTQVNDMKKAMAEELGEEKADDILRHLEESQDETCGDDIEYKPKIKGLSPYAVVFDATHPWWAEDPRYRYKNFYTAQCHLNDILIARAAGGKRQLKKCVFMNDVYEEIQYPDTELGTHSGYYFDPKNHPEVDNMIEFIFVDPNTGKRITDFPDGITDPVYIDFNVNYGYVTQFMEGN